MVGGPPAAASPCTWPPPSGLCHAGIQLQLLNIQPGLKSKEGDLQGVRVSDVVEGVSQVGVELDQVSLGAVSRT